MNDRSEIWGVVLAAGLSRRFGARNKLTALVEGVPLVRRTVEAFVGASLAGVLVVTGHEREDVEAALAPLHVRTVVNPNFEAGQSTSLRTGVADLPESAVAAVIGVADQPSLTSATIDRLLAERARTGALIVAPRYARAPGNPVLFASELFPELCEVAGDIGGREVIARHRHRVHWVEIADAHIGLDVDRPHEVDDEGHR